jgi:hypothetical protein
VGGTHPTLYTEQKSLQDARLLRTATTIQSKTTTMARGRPAGAISAWKTKDVYDDGAKKHQRRRDNAVYQQGESADGLNAEDDNVKM